MKTFKEVFDELKASQNMSKNGKVIKTFSKTDFDRLIKAFLNDNDYTTQMYSKKDGEGVTKDVAVIQQLREGFIKPILTLAGVDKQEASTMAKEIQISSVDGLYEFISEAIYVYMSAGKKFEFMRKEDFTGSTTLADLLEVEKMYRVVGTGNEVKIRKEAHKKLIGQSKCPDNKKKKV